MSRDLTLVRVDVSLEPVDRILRAIPGVGPAGGRNGSDDGEGGRTPARRQCSPSSRGTGRWDPDRTGRLGEPTATDPTTETPLDRSPDSTAERPREMSPHGPVGETPPPGAPAPAPQHRDEADGGSKRLLALAAAALLALVAALAALLWKRRSGGTSSGPSLPTDALPVVGDANGSGTDGDDRERTETRVDTAPLVGMAALAAMAAVVRRIDATDPSAP